MSILTEIKKNKDLLIVGDNKKLTLLGLRGSFCRIIGTTNNILNNNELEEMSDSIRTIHLNALECYTLLENLVHLTKMKRIDYQVETITVNIASIIKKVISFYRHKIILKKLDINLTLDEDSKISFQENMLSLIVRNIILNAIELSHQGGEIEIITKRGSDYLNFVVIDKGVGITPASISEILNNSDKYNYDKAEDTLLGLKLCKDYIERIKGDFIIGSQLGMGSRFELKFPTQQI
jgi:two-component system, sensor histidine kinase and response regulator